MKTHHFPLNHFIPNYNFTPTLCSNRPLAIHIIYTAAPSIWPELQHHYYLQYNIVYHSKAIAAVFNERVVCTWIVCENEHILLLKLKFSHFHLPSSEKHYVIWNVNITLSIVAIALHKYIHTYVFMFLFSFSLLSLSLYRCRTRLQPEKEIGWIAEGGGCAVMLPGGWCLRMYLIWKRSWKEEINWKHIMVYIYFLYVYGCRSCSVLL